MMVRCLHSETGTWQCSDTLLVNTTDIQTPRYSHLIQELPSLGVMKYFDKSNTGLLSTRKAESISPHVVMGISCIVILACISGVTIILVAINKRGSQQHILMSLEEPEPQQQQQKQQQQQQHAKTIKRKFVRIFRREKNKEYPVENDDDEEPSQDIFTVSSTENLFVENNG